MFFLEYLLNGENSLCQILFARGCRWQLYSMERASRFRYVATVYSVLCHFALGIFLQKKTPVDEDRC
jgi:hypothetical protein